MQTNKGQVARSVRFDIATDKNEEFHKLFKNEVLPILKKQDGFKDELLLVQDQHVLAISVWNNVDSARKYESTTYPQVDKTLRPVMFGKATVESLGANGEGSLGSGWRLVPTTRMPSAAHSRPTSRPMPPAPTTHAVLPSISNDR